MPYVERDSDTKSVKGVYANLQPGYAEEWKEPDDPEVVAFHAPKPVAPPPVDPVAARLAALEAVLFAGKPVTDASVDNTQKQLTSADVAAINAPPA